MQSPYSLRLLFRQKSCKALPREDDAITCTIILKKLSLMPNFWIFDSLSPFQNVTIIIEDAFGSFPNFDGRAALIDGYDKVLHSHRMLEEKHDKKIPNQTSFYATK